MINKLRLLIEDLATQVRINDIAHHRETLQLVAEASEHLPHSIKETGVTVELTFRTAVGRKHFTLQLSRLHTGSKILYPGSKRFAPRASPSRIREAFAWLYKPVPTRKQTKGKKAGQ